MLKRHGTRLEIGTAEDVAELNAAEALLRASFKPVTTGFTNIGSSSNMASSSAVAVDLGGGMGGGFGASVSTRPGGAGSASGYSLPGAMARSQQAGESGGDGDGQPPSSATATPTSAYGGGAAPHVRLGHPTSATAAAAAAPTPASSSSAMSVHAQRALYRSGAGGSDVGSPPSRGSVGTDYAASSGPTPGGSGVGPGGRRATAQPLFFSPHSSGGFEEEDEDDVVEVRGRPSMMRAPFAVPVPAASTRGSAPSMGGGGGEPHVPAGMQVPSAYARRGGPPGMPLPVPSRPHVLVDDGEGDEDEEEAPARPSRVSGRYQLPRSPGHGDPAGL